MSTGEQRAYSLLHIKAVNAEQRTLSGVASTPEPDRVGDVIEPTGVSFKNPLPLLLYHDKTRPVGTVRFDKPTKEGVTFTAQIASIADPGTLKDRVDEAWQSIKAGLIRGVSIGFRVLNDAVDLMQDTGGLRFRETELLELSLVTVPANASALIQTIKQYDVDKPAATGKGSIRITKPHQSGVTDHRGKAGSAMAKTIGEQIKDFEATRAAKFARMTEIMTKVSDEGRTLDDGEAEEHDGLQTDVESIDKHLKRLADQERLNVATATAVTHAKTVEEGGRMRDAQRANNVITVQRNLPPGIEFAQALLCKIQAVLSGGAMSAMEIAKERYPDNQRIQMHLKAAVPAGTSTQAVWAGPLVDQTNLAGEFIEYLRPMTIIGKLNLRRVPFNVRITGQTSGGTGYWVGEGKPKPLTSFAFNAITMLYTKVAAIAVITEELARFSSPGAEGLVRDALAAALIERIDRDFIDPGVTASTGVRPASITNGVVPLSSAGTSADNIRTDIQNLLEQFILNNMNPGSLALIMPQTLALAASMLVNDLGNPEFPGITMTGGSLRGIPVVTSQYAADESGSGNLVIAVDQSEILLADDGGVTVDVSREAAVEMSDAPTQNATAGVGASLVSMWQTNSLALRAERFINWSKRRTTAVSFIDDVNWGAIGSP